MRAVLLVFAIGTGAIGTSLLGQSLPALDVVLLVEESTPVTSLVNRSDLSVLYPNDRVAVMTFSGEPSLKLRLDADPIQIGEAIHKLDSTRTQSETHLWDAIRAATRLFDATPDPSRKRAIFLVFLARGESSAETSDSVRAALQHSHVSLSAAAITRAHIPMRPQIQKAPARRNCSGPGSRTSKIRCYPVPLPGPQGPEVWSDEAPDSLPPEKTLAAVRALVLETGGLVLENAWSLRILADHARNQ